MNVEKAKEKKLLLQTYECFCSDSCIFIFCLFIFHNFCIFFFVFFFHFLSCCCCSKRCNVYNEWIFLNFLCVRFHSILDTGRNEVIGLSRLFLTHKHRCCAAAAGWRSTCITYNLQIITNATEQTPKLQSSF